MDFWCGNHKYLLNRMYPVIQITDKSTVGKNTVDNQWQSPTLSEILYLQRLGIIKMSWIWKNIAIEVKSRNPGLKLGHKIEYDISKPRVFCDQQAW